jgi:hypothetical protein
VATPSSGSLRLPGSRSTSPSFCQIRSPLCSCHVSPTSRGGRRSERGQQRSICKRSSSAWCPSPFLAPHALIPQILTVLFGAPYLLAATTLGVLMVHGLVVSINIGFGTPLIAVGRQKAYPYTMTAGTAVGVALNVAVIPFLGAEGAALATLADELVILILFVRSSPEVSVSHTAHFGGQCLIAAIPAAIVVHCASMLPIIDGSDIAILVVGGSAGSIIYLLILRPVRIDIVSWLPTCGTFAGRVGHAVRHKVLFDLRRSVS